MMDACDKPDVVGECKQRKRSHLVQHSKLPGRCYQIGVSSVSGLGETPVICTELAISVQGPWSRTGCETVGSLISESFAPVFIAFIREGKDSMRCNTVLSQRSLEDRREEENEAPRFRLRHQVDMFLGGCLPGDRATGMILCGVNRLHYASCISPHCLTTWHQWFSPAFCHSIASTPMHLRLR